MTTKMNSPARTNAPAKKAPLKKAAANKATAAPKPAVTEQARMHTGSAAKQTEKKAKKNHRDKVVRDSFTMPQSEYRKIAEIKETCLEAGLHVKKSEVLRAGLQALCGMNAAQLKQSLGSLEKIRTGRPKKH